MCTPRNTSRLMRKGRVVVLLVVGVVVGVVRSVFVARRVLVPKRVAATRALQGPVRGDVGARSHKARARYACLRRHLRALTTRGENGVVRAEVAATQEAGAEHQEQTHRAEQRSSAQALRAPQR